MESMILTIELNRIKTEKEILESKILEFYTILDNWDHLENSSFIKDKYQEYFKIQTERQTEKQGYID